MRECKLICPHLAHVKSLRWVKNKYKYKYCYKCGVYFCTTRITCECCKDTLRVRYRNKPARHIKVKQRNRIRSSLHYVIKHEEYVVRNLVYGIIQGARKVNYKRLWSERNRDKIVNYRRQYYLINYK